MRASVTRRQFLRSAAVTGSLVGLGDLGFLSRLPSVSAEEAKLDPRAVRLRPEIEPLVRLVEATPRERLLEEVAFRIHRGLSYRDVLAALLLAGVRNIQPRPVGFKFHAVLVVNSAHLASLSSPDSDRWLPIFWALDYFKQSQAENIRQGGWVLGPVEESKVPPAHRARQTFLDAMDNWDEAAADAAVVSLARSAGAQDLFEIFCHYGARDFREIGHKAIYVANSWRALQCIGWQHAEPVLRSLAYALLDHDGENPTRRDAEPDRPFRANLGRLAAIRTDWRAGKPSAAATTEMLATLRQGSSDDSSNKAIELLNHGVGAESVWDALFDGACEILMRQPGILALHAVTSANALHYSFQMNGHDETRRLLLLQCAAFQPLFRGAQPKPGVQIDQLEPLALNTTGPHAIEEIFADLGRDRMTAARKVLAYLQTNPEPGEFMDAARRLIFLKGNNPHDYKFSAAVFEDFHHSSPGWRERYLAAGVFNLRGSGAPDNELVKRTRAALSA
ncbi:MAG: hypothetical protein ACYDH9_08435 [Limisphaerales bacterium]